MRFIAHLKRSLKARTVAQGTLQTYEDYFRAIMSSFPEGHQVGPESYVDPGLLTPVLVLQFARFHLFRHNLSSACHHAERVDALNRCLLVAQDTAKYISRSMLSPPPGAFHDEPSFRGGGDSWRTRILATAKHMLCTHLWRCTLVLCFRADYVAALTCVRVCAAIGPQRKVNAACGRNLAFFLDRLTERVQSGNGAPGMLEMDEELLAYVSGDLQGCTENSWVWAGSETGIKLNSHSSAAANPNAKDAAANKAALSGSENGDHMQVEDNTDEADDDERYPAPRMNSMLASENEIREWGGWERVERQISMLLEDQQRSRQTQQAQVHAQQMQQPPPSAFYHPQRSPHMHNNNIVAGNKRAADVVGSLPPPPPPPPPPPSAQSGAEGGGTGPPGSSGSSASAGGTSRISIANII